MSVRIGCHLSVAKGFANMIARGDELGAQVVQYFPKNPKSYRPKKFDPADLQKQAEKASEYDIETVCHSPYVTNLSTSDPKLRGVSIESIVNDLEIADAYGTRYLVVHCGKHVGQGPEKGVELMVEAVDDVMRRFDGATMLLLENTAGQGSELGQEIAALSEIHSRLEQPERVGICFDTCHAFAAGVLDYDEWEAFETAFTHPDFLSLVRVIHLNDSKVPFGERKDRHELLGQGEIGAERLARFLNLAPDLPVVIETPVDDESQYADEIATARSWLK